MTDKYQTEEKLRCLAIELLRKPRAKAHAFINAFGKHNGKYLRKKLIDKCVELKNEGFEK